MSDAQTWRSKLHSRARRSKWTHRILVVLNLLVVLAFASAVGLFALLVSPWVWPLIVLPVLYGVGAGLYSLESKFRLPGWLAQSIELAATLWPPITWLATSEQVRAANGVSVESFNRTLHEYGLEPFSEELSAELSEFARRLGVRALATEWRKERERHGRGADQAMPEVDALELLHRERRGESTFNLWQRAKEREGFVEALAKVVRHGERLPKRDSTQHALRDADVGRLLAAMRDLDVELLADELRAVNRLGERLRRYAQFASADPARALGATDGVVASIEARGGLPTGRSTLFRLDGAAETMALLKEVEDCKDPALGTVHRGIFLAEHDLDAGSLKERACEDALERRQAGGPIDPVEVLQAYLWEKYRRRTAAKRRHDPDQKIACEELDSGWSDWAGEARKALEASGPGACEKDLLTLVERLQVGIWQTDRAAPDEPVEGGTAPSNPYPIMVPVFVPEHDEVRDLDAYVITFDDRVGPIAEIVDGLRDRDPYYRFGHYTKNTRLGILPRGVPFHEFVEKLFNDLDRTLHDRFGNLHDPTHRLDKLELTVNRVDLAHCRELWFGDPKLGGSLRKRPSIDNVLTEITPRLDDVERPPVTEAFARVAGGHHGH